MRSYIDIVREYLMEDVVPFKRREQERSFFTPEDRFVLVITEMSGAEPMRQRKIVTKQAHLSLAQVMEYFRRYDVRTREPDEARYWVSAPSDDNSTVYALHVFLDDGAPLTLPLFRQINRMIENEYASLLGTR